MKPILMSSLAMLMMSCTPIDSADENSFVNDNEGEVVEIDKGLKSRVPKHWKKEKTINRFRVYQFSIPPAKGAKKGGEVVVYFFGEGAGGGVEQNLKRWKGFFDSPTTKTDTFKVGKATVHYLDLKGTYLYKYPPFDPNAKTQRLKNYRQFALYFDSPKGPYFLRMTGPAELMAAEKEGFDKWVKGFK